ncbi:MAG: Trp biosynthesis-associated membrane protein [Cocleimonas sp.]|nr:Trp biosynthesis-associated membrane protein [Cocleimonas sp.]
MASFFEQLHKVINLLESEGSISYRAIKRELDIDDDVLEDIKTELVEVKKIARDIDGKVLEVISESRKVVTTASLGEAVERTSSTIIKVSDQVTPTSEQLKGATEHIANTGDVLDEHKPVKRNYLILLGAACILVGVLLPWVSFRVSIDGLGMHRGRVTGLHLIQGFLSIAVGVFSAILSFVAARRGIPVKVVALVIIIIGIVVVGVAFDVITGVSTNDLSGFGGNISMGVRQTPKLGVYVTLLGGVFLLLGGLIALMRTRKRKN